MFFTFSRFSPQAPFNVTRRQDVMKWSNYVSICAIQMKPGVKFPICAPAALSSSLCFSEQCCLLGGNKPDMGGGKYYIQRIYLVFIIFPSMSEIVFLPVYSQNCQPKVMTAKRDL